jgi:hypothetical protein
MLDCWHEEVDKRPDFKKIAARLAILQYQSSNTNSPNGYISSPDTNNNAGIYDRTPENSRGEPITGGSISQNYLDGPVNPAIGSSPTGSTNPAYADGPDVPALSSNSSYHNRDPKTKYSGGPVVP